MKHYSYTIQMSEIDISKPQWGLSDHEYKHRYFDCYRASMILGVTMSTVAKYCRMGVVKASRKFSLNPNKGSWIITPENLDKFIKKYTHPKEEE